MSLAWYSSMVESAIIHWMPCFSASSEPCAKRLSERSTIMSSALAEHIGARDAQVLDDDLGVAGGAVHGLDLAHALPALRRDVDDEPGVGRLRPLRIVLGAGDENGEVGAAGVGDEPLV